jgi:hypothetical protein
MASNEKQMWIELGHVLEHRPGWSFEAQTTPGSAPCWCYSSFGRNGISVGIDAGAILLYLIDIDKEIKLTDAEALAVWLDDNGLLFA